MLLAQFSVTWERIYNGNGNEEPKGLVENHEAWETNERCISIIGDGPRDENLNTIRKGKRHSTKKESLGT